MRELAIILNFFIPGLGTLIVGKVGQGIAQLLLFIIGLLLFIVGFFLSASLLLAHGNILIPFLVGFLICLAVWLWGLIGVARMPISSTRSPASRTGDSAAAG